MSSAYSCLRKDTYRRGGYELIPIREQDMDAIREWRNAQLDILRQRGQLSDEDQADYWSKVLMPAFADREPSQILFSFIRGGDCIGYGGLTHIDWISKRGEVSFLLDPKRTADGASYTKEFHIFLGLLKEVAFDYLGFHRMYTETFDKREVHVAAIESFGFVHEGTLKDHVYINHRYYDSLIHGLINHGHVEKR